MRNATFLLVSAILASSGMEARAAAPREKSRSTSKTVGAAPMSIKEQAQATPIAPGYVRRPYMGFNMRLRSDGQMEIANVTKGQGADKGGMQLGDILVAIGGHPTKRRVDVMDALMKQEIGEMVPVTVLRNGARVDLNIEAGFADIREVVQAIKRVLYEEKKVSLAVMGGEIVNVKITDRLQLEQWAKGIKSDLIANWENRLLKAFPNEKNYSLVDRQAVEQIIKELNFGQSGMVSEQFRAKLGQTLGATHLLTIEFSRFGNADVEKQRLIEIETGKLLFSGKQSTPLTPTPAPKQ